MLYIGPPAHDSGRGNKPIHRIVIHGTVSPCVEGGARDIARYFRSPAAGGSAHAIADPGEVVRGAYDDVICWHAPPNQHSLGLEFCDPMNKNPARWHGRKHKRMLRRGAKRVAHWCHKYGIPVDKLTVADLRAGVDGIAGHVNVSTAFHQSSHWDPGPFFPWRWFLKQIKAEHAGKSKPVSESKHKPDEPRRPEAVRDAIHACLDAADDNAGHPVRLDRLDDAMRELRKVRQH